MTLFTSLVPTAQYIDWQTIQQTFAWFRRMEGCLQSPIHHGEGDVLIHTRMVCESLIADPAWQALNITDRQSLFWAALLHDVAKPECTRVDSDGKMTSRGHGLRGQVMARNILWRLGVPFVQRELICHLITHHQLPFFILERKHPERIAHQISLQTRCDFVAMLADADARGRICTDQRRLLDNIELFRQLCRDEDCFSTPKAFPSPHSRFLYFRKVDRSVDFEAFDDTHVAVTLLSGLPASGKDHWVATHLGDNAVISLDALRRKLNILPTDNQGAVISAAKAEARRLLAAGKPFIWNATNIGTATRSALIDLFAAYGAKVTIVYIETNEPELLRRNAARAERVPDAAIARMLDRWQPPDLSECHDLLIRT